MEPWILLSTKKSWRTMSGHLFVTSSWSELGFCSRTMIQNTSKSTSEWLKKNKMKTLEWPSQSPDLNPIEMLWHDLKKAVHARKPSNVAELQQFCQDEWQGSKLRPFWSHMLPKCNLCDSKIYLGAFVRVQIIVVVRPLQLSAKRSRITV